MIRIFIISVAVAILLMGCAASNHTPQNAATQSIDSTSPGDQPQMCTISPHINDDGTWPFDDAWQIYRACSTGANDACVVSTEEEIDEQFDIQQAPEYIQQADETAAISSESGAAANADDIDSTPESQQFPEVVQSDTDKVIYLTFDDGPSSNTPKILDILKRENVKATFFVTGHHRNYTYLIKREFDEGHAIGAHSFSHHYDIYASQEAFFKDLEKLQKVIEKYTGSRTRLIRFPGGSSNTSYRLYNEDPYFMNRLCYEVRRRGYQYIDWNLSSKDSSSSFVSTSTIIEMATRDKSNDICLLMHDTFGKETTVAALPAIIQYYKEKGYRFGILDTTSFGYHHVHLFPRR